MLLCSFEPKLEVYPLLSFPSDGSCAFGRVSSQIPRYVGEINMTSYLHV